MQANMKQKVLTHNVWAASVARYFYGALGWPRRDLIALDRATRRVLRKLKAHRYSAAGERLYLPRAEGGRGLIAMEDMWEQEAVSVARVLEKYDLEQNLDGEGAKIGAVVSAEQRATKWQRLEGKKLHGVYAMVAKERETDRRSNRWLVEGRLRAETEAFVVAAQDGVLKTNVS